MKLRSIVILSVILLMPVISGGSPVNKFSKEIDKSISFYMPFEEKPQAAYARGDDRGNFSSDHFPYRFYLQEGIEGKALVVAAGNVLKFKTEKNFNRRQGSICFWLRPLFDWEQKAGRIPFDIRYNEDAAEGVLDPSQRMALTYSVGKGRCMIISLWNDCGGQ
jgi:hypothetical protein